MLENESASASPVEVVLAFVDVTNAFINTRNVWRIGGQQLLVSFVGRNGCLGIRALVRGRPNFHALRHNNEQRLPVVGI